MVLLSRIFRLLIEIFFLWKLIGIDKRESLFARRQIILLLGLFVEGPVHLCLLRFVLLDISLVLLLFPDHALNDFFEVGELLKLAFKHALVVILIGYVALHDRLSLLLLLLELRHPLVILFLALVHELVVQLLK